MDATLSIFIISTNFGVCFFQNQRPERAVRTKISKHRLIGVIFVNCDFVVDTDLLLDTHRVHFHTVDSCLIFLLGNEDLVEEILALRNSRHTRLEPAVAKLALSTVVFTQLTEKLSGT